MTKPAALSRKGADGVRINKIRHDEETRAKIKVAHILHRLTQCMDGEVELSPVQISCAKILLSKALPDLSSVEVRNDSENPVTITEVVHLVVDTREQADMIELSALTNGTKEPN